MKFCCSVSANPAAMPCVIGPGTLFLAAKAILSIRSPNETTVSSPVAVTSGLREVISAVVAPALQTAVPVPAKARVQGQT